MNTFKKEERLCSKKLIEELLHNGSSFLLYPLKVVWLIKPANEPNPYPTQLVISVAKKRFRRANKRNKVKRLIRESYRINKEEHLYNFLKEQQLTLLLMFSYVGKDIFTYSDLEKKIKLCLHRVVKEIEKR
ncbi:ribonuclease P protein component [Solitalea koreensis]|uniref:Ribonuclease P protein component n=1 Tax=Solitalea koreensis TaxID=543615 RepID=A0A521ED74_9SPHI|nr:ribonuclease P protein component [Solitalea koreensis]SMO81401.1 ribonuclease P protein component [Solitalea koreensis]